MLPFGASLPLQDSEVVKQIGTTCQLPQMTKNERLQQRGASTDHIVQLGALQKERGPSSGQQQCFRNRSTPKTIHARPDLLNAVDSNLSIFPIVLYFKFEILLRRLPNRERHMRGDAHSENRAVQGYTLEWQRDFQSL